MPYAKGMPYVRNSLGTVWPFILIHRFEFSNALFSYITIPKLSSFIFNHISYLIIDITLVSLSCSEESTVVYGIVVDRQTKKQERNIYIGLEIDFFGPQAVKLFHLLNEKIQLRHIMPFQV